MRIAPGPREDGRVVATVRSMGFSLRELCIWTAPSPHEHDGTVCSLPRERGMHITPAPRKNDGTTVTVCVSPRKPGMRIPPCPRVDGCIYYHSVFIAAGTGYAHGFGSSRRRVHNCQRLSFTARAASRVVPGPREASDHTATLCSSPQERCIRHALDPVADVTCRNILRAPSTTSQCVVPTTSRRIHDVRVALRCEHHWNT